MRIHSDILDTVHRPVLFSNGCGAFNCNLIAINPDFDSQDLKGQSFVLEDELLDLWLSLNADSCTTLSCP